MELIDVTTQETIISMINDVNRVQKVSAFRRNGQLFYKGKYEDALYLIADSFDESELTERLKNVLPNVFKDWHRNFLIYGHSFNTTRQDVDNLFNSQGIPNQILITSEIKKIDEELNTANEIKTEKRSRYMSELTKEQKEQYVANQKRLKQEYQSNVASQLNTMFKSKENLETAISNISKTSSNFSLTNRMALANQKITDNLLTREAWNKMGFYPKGANVTTHVSVPSGTYQDSNGNTHQAFKQQAVYGTQKFEHPKVAAMAFEKRTTVNGLLKYPHQIRSHSFNIAAKSLNEKGRINKNSPETEIAKYLYRKDNKLIQADKNLELKTDIKLPENDHERRKFIAKVSEQYRVIDSKTRSIAFEKDQELAKENENSQELQDQKHKHDMETDKGLEII